MSVHTKQVMRNLFKPRMEHERLVALLEPLSAPLLDHAALKALASYCESCSITKLDTRGSVPLHLAAFKSSQPAVIDLFLEKGETINRTDKTSFSALHVSCEQGNESIVHHLLLKGIDANIRTTLGYDAGMCALAPLLEPSINHSPKRLQLLNCCLLVLDYLQDVDRTTTETNLNRGFCLLHLAVKVSALPVVRRLLGLGAKIPDHDGKFREPFDAIMHSAVEAASFGRFKMDGLEILKLLLENGGNANERLTHPRRYLLDHRPDAKKVSEILTSYGARGIAESSGEVFSWKKKAESGQI